MFIKGEFWGDLLEVVPRESYFCQEELVSSVSSWFEDPIGSDSDIAAHHDGSLLGAPMVRPLVRCCEPSGEPSDSSLEPILENPPFILGLIVSFWVCL